MYLSKLSMQGFKSFARQTELAFDPGVTAVVGPNGCGKSNIVDAVRWVTGEQRARILRSDKMDSVIFNGTAKRKPLGLSEVSLTIQNTRGVLPTEYSEVTIGRRLYRSGESEYLLNGSQCRLKDILDLFMDTGMGPGAYSVIELKMIEEILSENNQERRRLFEEAAGITKYKVRRTQALKKLDSTQANLTRLRDLTEEIGKRVENLKRQAEKAAEARKIQEEMRDLELSLAQAGLNRYLEQEADLLKETRQLQSQIEASSTEQTRDEADLESLQKKLIDYEKELSGHQKKLNEHLEEVRSLETEKKLILERTNADRRLLERTTLENDDSQRKITLLLQSIKQVKVELAEARPRAEKAESVAAKAREESERMAENARKAWDSLQSLRSRQETLEEERRSRIRNLDRIANRIELLTEELSLAKEKANDFNASSGQSTISAKELEEELEKKRARADELHEEMQETDAKEKDLQEKIERALESLRQVERQHDAVAAEVQLLASLISSYEDFSESVQYLADTEGWTENSLLTVADVLGCRVDDQLAVNAALGAFSSCVVVKSEAEAISAFNLLRENEKGQTELIVLDRLEGFNGDMSHMSMGDDLGARPLPSIIRAVEPVYQPLVDALLHNCFLVKSLEHGQEVINEMLDKLGSGGMPIRCFVRSGEWIDDRGIMRGGSETADQNPQMSRMQRREQHEQAIQSLRKLQEAMVSRQAELRDYRKQMDNLPIEETRRQQEEARVAFIETDKEYARVLQEQESFEKRRQELSLRVEELTESIKASNTESEELMAPMASTVEELEALRSQHDEAEEAFRSAEGENRAAMNKFSEINVEAVQERNKLDNLERDLNRAEERLSEQESLATDREAQIDVLNKNIDDNLKAKEELDKQIETLYAVRPDLDKAVSAAEQELMNTKTEIYDIESRLKGLRQSREKEMREENMRAVRLAEIQTRANDLVEKILEEHNRSLKENPIVLPVDFKIGPARESLQKNRSRLRNLGSINELALESYEEEKERFEFLTAQKQDLEQAEETLLETISEINETAATSFDETFQQIRVNFAELFSTLFGKDDTADLILENETDPLESPIMIVAKPKGKRPSAISQLSGGEKTLTATALLFAIYLVKPSPFCILDEVDAPLDEANVERFMELIRKFSDRTQFIMVTHNRRTMELADRLYGVTMQEEGVSELVGVKFDEASEMVDEVEAA